MSNIFKRTLRKREQEAGTQEKDKPAKKQESGPSQADFFYGSSSDLKKKGNANRPPQSKKW